MTRAQEARRRAELEAFARDVEDPEERERRRAAWLAGCPISSDVIDEQDPRDVPNGVWV